MPLAIGLYFGSRIGETLAASWELCDIENRLLAFEFQIQRLTLKGHKSFHYICDTKTPTSHRRLRFDERIRELLAAWRKQQIANELACGGDYFYNYIVPAKDFQGRPIDRIISLEKAYPAPGKRINLICTQTNGKYIKPSSVTSVCSQIRQMGVHGFNFHCLRYTNLTMLGEGRSTINEIKARAGHTDYRTSENYIVIRPEMQDRPVEILSRKLRSVLL